MALIYIVEDDKNIQEIESYALKGNGFDVRTFDDGKSFDKGISDMLPDMISYLHNNAPRIRRDL